jgi:hypothetical protein
MAGRTVISSTLKALHGPRWPHAEKLRRGRVQWVHKQQSAERNGLSRGVEPDAASGSQEQTQLHPAKLASRLLQRVTTSPGARKRAAHATGEHDATAEDPVLQRPISTVTGEVKGRIRSRLLLRLGTGGVILVPAIGVYFLGRAIAAEASRARTCTRSGSTRAAAAFTAAAAVDAVNLAATLRGLGNALAEHTPLFLQPDVGGEAAHAVRAAAWYAHWVTDVLAMPHSLPLTLTVMGTGAAMAGEVYSRYDTLAQFARHVAPQATDTAALAAEHAANGQLARGVGAAAAAADQAVDELAPDLTAAATKDRAAAEALGDRVAAVAPDEAAQPLRQAVLDASRQLERQAAGRPASPRRRGSP